MADLPGCADCAGHFDPDADEDSILPIPIFRNVAQDNAVRTRTEITTDFLPVLYSIASILVSAFRPYPMATPGKGLPSIRLVFGLR